MNNVSDIKKKYIISFMHLLEKKTKTNLHNMQKGINIIRTENVK